MQVRIEKHILSDHSEVFDIVVSGGTRFHAVDEKSAMQLAEAIVAAVNEYTCDDIEIAFDVRTVAA